MTATGASPARRLGALRARLAAREDSEHEMSLNRLAIVTIAFGYVLVAHTLGFADATAALVHGQVLCAAYLACSVLIFLHLLHRPGVSHARRHVALLLDMGTLSIGMHIGDSAFSLGYPIYLWIIFGNGFRFGVDYLFRASACAVVGFSLMALHTPIWSRDADLALGLLFGLVALPAYVAVLIRKLSEAKRQAEEASKAKSMFLASVSHELRTPLNAIISFSDLLGHGRLDREQKSMAATIGDSGRSLLGLINNILDFSRIEAGKQPVRIDEFNLPACLDRARRVLAVQAGSKSIYLHVWIGPDVPVDVIGSEQELQQVVLNLAGNAVKFTQQGGVTIAVRRENRLDEHLWLRVDVADTGIGIAPQAQARIFESFSQADDSIMDRFGGTGLGLAIARQLVERHGGAIAVTSAPGRGSTFSFTFRMAAAPLRAADAPPCSAIIVTHQPALAVQFGQLGAKPQWVTSVSGARAALETIDEATEPPIVIFDRETMSEAAFGNLAAVISETGRHIVVGVLSETPDDSGRTAGFPMCLSIGPRVSQSDWTRLTAASRQVLLERPPSEAGAPAVALRILVAEDNVTNQQVIRRMLERGGHEIVIAANGEDAVEALEKDSFDLVLMDINMPVMNGYEATKLHRFASLGRRRVPIHALTADVTPETRAKAEEAGMDGCLHKPIERSELNAVIEAVGRLKAPDAPRAPPSSVVDPTHAQSGQQPASAESLDFNSIPAVDAAALAGLADLGGPQFVKELSLQFVADAWRKLDEIGFAVADLDAQAFREVTHSLRSSAANLGARRLFAMCLEWRALGPEQLAQDGEAKLAQLRSALLETEADLAAIAARIQFTDERRSA